MKLVVAFHQPQARAPELRLHRVDGKPENGRDVVHGKILERREHEHLALRQRKGLDRALEDYRKARMNLDALAEPETGSSTIHPQYVTRLVSELADDDAIFSCDVGTPVAWTARYLKMNGKRRLIAVDLRAGLRDDQGVHDCTIEEDRVGAEIGSDAKVRWPNHMRFKSPSRRTTTW